MALDPSVFGAQGTPSVPLNDFVKTYDDSIVAAQNQYDTALKRLGEAKATKDRIDQQVASGGTSAALLLGDQQKAADAEYQHASQTAEQSQALVVRAHDAKGAAIERYSQRANISPELAQRYKADADLAAANAQAKNTENFEALNAIPEKRAQLAASTAEAQANTKVAQAKADVASATTPTEIAAAQTRLDQANTSLKSTQLANTQAGLQNQITAAQAAVAPQTARAAADTATNQAAITGAQAGVAPQAAQAAVDKAQADVNKTNQELADLQRAARQAPTDAQAQQAIQTQLQQKQVELQAAQTQLEAAQKLMPLSVAQAGANVEATQAGTQKGLLGNLYGMPERIKAIADALRSGQIVDKNGLPDIAAARQQLQNYINTTIAGTTPFEAQNTALDTETQRRQQDYTLAGNQMSALGSFGGSALGNMLQANRDAPAGSTAMAQSYGGIMGAMMGAFQGMNPQVPMNSPLLQSMSNMGGVGAASAPVATGPAGPAAPTTTITPDGTVTIQHTSSDPATMATGIMGPSQGGAGPLPAMLAGTQMATPDHVSALWANDPNLNPGAMAASGAVDRTSQGLGGM